MGDWESRDILYLGPGGGCIGICLCQNSLNCTLKMEYMFWNVSYTPKLI